MPRPRTCACVPTACPPAGVDVGLVLEQYGYAFGAEALGDQFGNLRVFTHQQARRHFHLRHFGTKSGEGLRQFRADWAAAENDEARG